MAKRKLTQAELLRAISQLPEYPAVLLPVSGGGFSVVFPNIPKLTAFAHKREAALKAGQEALTAYLQPLVQAGEAAPQPSDPARLIPDEDEPLGTELVTIGADRNTLLKRLGLEKNKDKGLALAHFGRLGK
ncbi:MAG: type II toxin-antitoxin system HicB family antitoxin [Desulfarculus sp.]|nr:type II toxin-antitoxin system HicB family antitoxin [Desulfarculus sp.]